MATKLSRRSLLQQMLSLAAGASLFSPAGIAYALTREGAQAEEYLLLGCTKQHGKHQLSAMASNGDLRYQLDLPARGHYVAVANTPQPVAACIARRPGHYIAMFNPHTGQPVHELTPPAKMHFYGHAVFSEDANKLYVTAGYTANSQGAILVYLQQDNTWQLSQTWPLAGLGPHQLLLLPSKRLVVAVGGIHTQGRDKLNLDDMQPALVYLNSESGEQLLSRSLDNSQLSIRHLSYSPQTDTVWLACQGQNPKQTVRSLIYSHKGEQACQALDPDADYWSLFEHYIGSVVCSNGTVLASSPRGAKLAAWSEADRELQQLIHVDDVCGLATHEKGWLASTGQGQLLHTSNKLKRQHTTLQWDNHLSVMPIQ
ncbi:DUF1513 domain-containing protein [Agarivorans sp. 1_MG-2023]|uniref:DUF1513 domain-containing protein n=1 Tax=Agarivorans sp. 1_MG-2023 TaxID=3062634 RepID=UPI0026E46F59|nr:DUF1513 domain-containing protein [Agarivorans sp. 1_MG-2023]MDO6762815.1 DUF1513 domain-containing protein [Agarivorans sp. 1_MG-2023]